MIFADATTIQCPDAHRWRISAVSRSGICKDAVNVFPGQQVTCGFDAGDQA